MARRDATPGRRRDELRRDSDGELRLSLRDDHLEHVPEPDGSLPAGPDPSELRVSSEAAVSTDVETSEQRAVEASNRARLAALHKLRSSGPVDFRDAFFGGLWVVLFVVALGVAARALLELGVLWAAALAFAVNLTGLGVVVGVLERRDRKLMREIEQGLTSPPPRHRFHWWSVTPMALMRRIGADLDAINIDDSALEDELEPLYQHGNKMDNGFSGGWR